MIILGIDPGVATTGVGVIRYIGSKFTLIYYGIISTPANTALPIRLEQIQKELTTIISTYNPDAVAIEDIFFHKNVKTAINVAQARGVLLLTVQNNKKPIVSYTPPEIKLGVCGYGKATKDQVQFMVKKLLKLSKIPKPDDAADALAISICHAHAHKYKQLAKTQK